MTCMSSRTGVGGLPRPLISQRCRNSTRFARIVLLGPESSNFLRSSARTLLVPLCTLETEALDTLRLEGPWRADPVPLRPAIEDAWLLARLTPLVVFFGRPKNIAVSRAAAFPAFPAFRRSERPRSPIP